MNKNFFLVVYKYWVCECVDILWWKELGHWGQILPELLHSLLSVTLGKPPDIAEAHYPLDISV